MYKSSNKSNKSNYESIETHKILSHEKLIKLSKLFNNSNNNLTRKTNLTRKNNLTKKNNKTNNKTRKNISSKAISGNNKRVIVVYSEVPDKKDLTKIHIFLNWCALFDGKKYYDIRKYKLLETKKETNYKMFINIYDLTQSEYEQMNKTHLKERNMFGDVRNQLLINKTPIKSKVITIRQTSNSGSKVFTILEVPFIFHL